MILPLFFFFPVVCSIFEGFLSTNLNSIRVVYLTMVREPANGDLHLQVVELETLFKQYQLAHHSDQPTLLLFGSSNNIG